MWESLTEVSLGKSTRPYLKNKLKAKRIRGKAQVIEPWIQSPWQRKKERASPILPLDILLLLLQAHRWAELSLNQAAPKDKFKNLAAINKTLCVSAWWPAPTFRTLTQSWALYLCHQGDMCLGHCQQKSSPSPSMARAVTISRGPESSAVQPKNNTSHNYK
jgi:hypothetical protein